jgi:hypothetical protein
MAVRPSSRRMANARSSSVRQAAVRPEKQATEDIDVDAPAPAKVVSFGEEADLAEAPSSSSSRRLKAGSSSRRMAAENGHSSRRSKVLTSEEQEDRARALKQGLILAVVLFVVIALGAIAFITLMKGDPVKDKAILALGQARAELISANSNLDEGNPIAAKTAIAAAHKSLDEVSTTDGGAAKVELLARLAALEDRAVQVERDVKVERNRRELIGRFGKIAVMEEVELTQLVKDGEAFLLNPVDPTSAVGADGIVLAAYKNAIGEIQAQIPRADSELVRRTKASTTTIVSATLIQAEGLCQEERFAEALKIIAEAKEAHPQADLSGVENDVKDAAAKAWNTAKTFADTRLADYKSKGLSEAMRNKARDDGKARMQKIIDTWNLPEYVTQAEAILATF